MTEPTKRCDNCIHWQRTFASQNRNPPKDVPQYGTCGELIRTIEWWFKGGKVVTAGGDGEDCDKHQPKGRAA